jgi:hypothetical protein
MRRRRRDLGAHEAAEGVLGRADDRLAAHVEAGVDQHRQPVSALKREQRRGSAGWSSRVHGLDARRVVDVRHGRDVERGTFSLSMPNSALGLGGHRDAAAPRARRTSSM